MRTLRQTEQHGSCDQVRTGHYVTDVAVSPAGLPSVAVYACSDGLDACYQQSRADHERSARGPQRQQTHPLLDTVTTRERAQHVVERHEVDVVLVDDGLPDQIGPDTPPPVHAAVIGGRDSRSSCRTSRRRPGRRARGDRSAHRRAAAPTDLSRRHLEGDDAPVVGRDVDAVGGERGLDVRGDPTSRRQIVSPSLARNATWRRPSSRGRAIRCPRQAGVDRPSKGTCQATLPSRWRRALTARLDEEDETVARRPDPLVAGRERSIQVFRVRGRTRRCGHPRARNTRAILVGRSRSRGAHRRSRSRPCERELRERGPVGLFDSTGRDEQRASGQQGKCTTTSCGRRLRPHRYNSVVFLPSNRFAQAQPRELIRQSSFSISGRSTRS